MQMSHVCSVEATNWLGRKHEGMKSNNCIVWKIWVDKGELG